MGKFKTPLVAIASRSLLSLKPRLKKIRITLNPAEA